MPEVYCDSYDCPYCEKIEEEHRFGEDQRIVPFDDAMFKGVCTRAKIFIRQQEIETPQTLHELGECMCRTATKIKGHMDFSRFPSGGHIPD